MAYVVSEECVACGTCSEVCPVEAIVQKNGGTTKELILIADRDHTVRIAGEILMNNKRPTTKVSLLHVRFFKFGDKL